MEIVLNSTLSPDSNEISPSLSPAFLTEESSKEQGAVSLIESPGLPVSPLPPELWVKILEMVVYRSTLSAELDKNIRSIRGTCRIFNHIMGNFLSHLDRDISLMEKTFGPHVLALTSAFLSLSLPPGYFSKFYVCHYEAFVFRLFRQMFPDRHTENLSKEFVVTTLEVKLKSLIKPHLKMEIDVRAALASSPVIPGSICRTMEHLVQPMPLLCCAALENPQHPEVVEFLMNDPVREKNLSHAIPNLLSQMTERNEVPTETDVQIVSSLYRHSVERLLQAHFFFSEIDAYGEVDERVVYIRKALLKLGGKFTAENWNRACEFAKPVKHDESFLVELFSILGKYYACFTKLEDIQCIHSGLKTLIWARLSVKKLDLISKIKQFLPMKHFNGILREIKNTYTERGFPYQGDRLIKPLKLQEGESFSF